MLEHLSVNPPTLDPNGSGWGIADQNDLESTARAGAANMFTDPLFEATNVRKVRRIVSWDVVARGNTPRNQPMGYQNCRRGPLPSQRNATNELVPITGDQTQDLNGDGMINRGTERSELDGLKLWMAAAKAKGIDVLISFQHSRPKESYCFLPTRPQYRAAVSAFRDLFPYVLWYTAWNEPNFKVQPTARRFDTKDSQCLGARQAARFWLDLKKECQRSLPRTPQGPLVKCSVGAGDFLDDATFDRARKASLGEYFQNYVGALKGQEPTVWAWHAYTAGYEGLAPNGRTKEENDKRVRSHSSDRLKRFMEATDYNSKRPPRVWLTEQGGEYHLHRYDEWDKKDRAGAEAAANADLAYLLTLPFKDFTESRITRMYIYDCVGAPENTAGRSDFDAGLLDVNDGLRPRLLYSTFKNKVTGTTG